MAERIIVGDTPTLTITFTVDGVDTDPTSVTLTVTDPSGNAATPSPSNPSTGVYTYNQLVDEAGLWVVKWEGDAPAADVDVSTFSVFAATPVSADLLTLPEAKERLGITDSTSDVSLAAVISAVSEQLDAHCGPIVNRTVTAELHDGGGHLFSLDLPPVSSVTSATEYDGTTATALTEQTVGTVPANGFTTSTGGVVRRLSGGDPDRFPAGSRNVSVTYVAGRYTDTATVAPKFKEAAEMVLRNVWTSELASGSQSFGGITDGFTNPLLGPGMLNKVMALLHGEMERPRV